MKLDVPLVLQDKNSLDCGLAGVSMLLAYYGITKSVEDIRQDISIYEGVGTFTP